MINDGKRVGLIPAGYQAVDDSVFDYLKGVAETQVEAPEVIPDFGETIEMLYDEQRALQRRLSELNQDLRAARVFLSDQTEFSKEANEQQARLQSMGLYKEDDAGRSVCPICDSKLTTPVPAVSELKTSLEKVQSQLAAVHKESPHLQSHIVEIEQQIDAVTQSLKIVQVELRNAISEDKDARVSQNQLIARARFLGKLADFVEITSPREDVGDLDEELVDVRNLLAAVRAKLNADETASRLETILNLIGRKMTEYSTQLDLEHSGSSLRLDLKRLTVVADTEDGPIPLQRMGSGENWVGYHVLTLLGIHWWLRRKHRPVPGFLILDQPTQAYYPPDVVEGDIERIGRDSDRRAVRGLFQLMHKACAEIAPEFQLIVLDHAHLRDDWFEDAIVEEWRGENALVPRSWRAL